MNSNATTHDIPVTLYDHPDFTLVNSADMSLVKEQQKGLLTRGPEEPVLTTPRVKVVCSKCRSNLMPNGWYDMWFFVKTDFIDRIYARAKDPYTTICAELCTGQSFPVGDSRRHEPALMITDVTPVPAPILKNATAKTLERWTEHLAEITLRNDYADDLIPFCIWVENDTCVILDGYDMPSYPDFRERYVGSFDTLEQAREAAIEELGVLREVVDREGFDRTDPDDELPLITPSRELSVESDSAIEEMNDRFIFVKLTEDNDSELSGVHLFRNL